MWCLVGAAVFFCFMEDETVWWNFGGNFFCCHRLYPPTRCSRREPLRRINLSSTFFFVSDCFFIFIFMFFCCFFLLFSFENVSQVHFSSFHCFPPRDVGSRQTGYPTNHAQQWGGSLLGSSLSWSLHTERSTASSMPLLHRARAFSSCRTAASSDWLMGILKGAIDWLFCSFQEKKKKNKKKKSPTRQPKWNLASPWKDVFALAHFPKLFAKRKPLSENKLFQKKIPNLHQPKCFLVQSLNSLFCPF